MGATVKVITFKKNRKAWRYTRKRVLWMFLKFPSRFSLHAAPLLMKISLNPQFFQVLSIDKQVSCFTLCNKKNQHLDIKSEIFNSNKYKIILILNLSQCVHWVKKKSKNPTYSILVFIMFLINSIKEEKKFENH